jgi:hypothetical protein
MSYLVGGKIHSLAVWDIPIGNNIIQFYSTNNPIYDIVIFIIGICNDVMIFTVAFGSCIM